MHVSEPGVERRAGDERPPQKVQSMSVPSAFGSSKRRVIGASQVESGKFILLQKVLVPGASVCCSSDLVGVRLFFPVLPAKGLFLLEEVIMLCS